MAASESAVNNDTLSMWQLKIFYDIRIIGSVVVLFFLHFVYFIRLSERPKNVSNSIFTMSASPTGAREVMNCIAITIVNRSLLAVELSHKIYFRNKIPTRAHLISRGTFILLGRGLNYEFI